MAISDAQYKAWLQADNVTRILLVEADCYDTALPAGLPSEAIVTDTKTATFTRASTATKQDGSIVAANAPRYETGRSGQAIMVEERTTNLLLWSNDFSTAVWNKTAVTLVGDLIIPDTSSGQKTILQAFPVTLGLIYTLTFEAKPSGYNFVQIAGSSGFLIGNFCNVDLSTGIISYSVGSSQKLQVSPTLDGWWRISFTDTAISTTTAQIAIIPLITNAATRKPVYTGNGVSGVHLRNAQLEQKAYATSYVPTTTVAATRAAESLTIPTAGVLNASAGTISIVFYEDGNPLHTYRFIFDTNGTGRTFLLYDPTTSKYKVQLDGVSIITAIAVPSVGWHRWTLTWAGTTATLTIDNILISTVIITTPTLAGVALLSLGSKTDTTLPLNNLIDDFRTYNRALTASEIAAIYNSTSLIPAELLSLTDSLSALSFDNTLALLTYSYQTVYGPPFLRTVYLSNGVYASQQTDTPAHMPYDDSVLAIPAFTSKLSDALQGFTMPSWGDIEISNELFDKDAWLDYAWDGRTIRLLYGDVSWARADFKEILVGTIAAISAPTAASLKLAIRDKQWLLNGPIQTRLVGEPVLVSGTTYKVSDSAVTSIDKVWDNGTLLTVGTQYSTNPGAGTFTLVTPATGRVTAQYTGGQVTQGQVVPLCFGPCFNITPVLVSYATVTSARTYQVHDGPVNAITNVRDSGVPLTLTTDYSVDLSTGKLSTVLPPIGELTCDVQGAKPAGTYLTKAGDQINYIATTRTPLTAGDVDAASLAAFTALCPQTLGIYIRDRRNTLDVFDELVTSVGGWYTFNRAGKLIFGRISVPSGSPVASLVADDVNFGKLRLVNLSSPPATLRIGYQKNYTIQANTAGSVTDPIYTQDTQIASRNNDAIKTVHPLAIEPDLQQTALALRAEALTEVDRKLTLWGTVRKTYEAECVLAPLSLNQGDVLLVTHPRYGLQAGKLLCIIGIAESVTTRGITLTLWG